MIYTWALPGLLQLELVNTHGPLIPGEGMDGGIPVEEFVQDILSEYSFTEYLKDDFDIFSLIFIVLAMATGFSVPARMWPGG